MKKPNILKKGDKVAIVSLSWGGLGDQKLIHRYEIAKERLEADFGLQAVAMPHALKGSQFIYEHPEARAQDLMDAFRDETIQGIICAIGGDDAIRLLPYIDYEVLANNPKIFMGYSDTTINHFMMHKAGLVSYYGPCIMCEFGEYVSMADYTKKAVYDVLFADSTGYSITSSAIWSKEVVPWSEENIHTARIYIREMHGYELLQGSGIVTGQILGGCIDVFPMIVGTTLWPAKEQWQGKILLLETSEDKMPPDYLIWYLRNLGAQGILDVVNGILVGKPMEETYYEEYKEAYKKVLKEYHQEELPVLYNINAGHASPIGVFPFGTEVQVDFTNKTITLLESAAEAGL